MFSVADGRFHRSHAGHPSKSGAAEDHVMYNRLTDDVAGRASNEHANRSLAIWLIFSMALQVQIEPETRGHGQSTTLR